MISPKVLLVLAFLGICAPHVQAQRSQGSSPFYPLSRQPGLATMQLGVLYPPFGNAGQAPSQLCRDMFSGTVQIRGTAVDPVTGGLRRYQTTTNPHSGVVQTHEFAEKDGARSSVQTTQSLVTGVTRSNHLTYDPRARSYVRQQSEYHPRRQTIRTTTDTYDQRLRSIQQVSSVHDLRSGRRATSRTAAPAREGSRRPPPYVWPPLDAELADETAAALER